MEETIKRFSRYELKYLLPSRALPALEDELLHRMDVDRHAGPDGSYRVTSLYYDSPDYALFRSKVSGFNFRRKLRARVYGAFSDPKWGQHAMVEIKQRRNKTTSKRRLCLPLPEALALCDGHARAHWDDPEDDEVAGEVGFMVRGLDLKPSCVVSYIRRALVGGETEPRLRVTFDTQVTAAHPPLIADESRLTQAVVPADWVIMEVKADERIPRWLTSVIARHDCSLRRVSKYCAGLYRLMHKQGGIPGVLEQAFSLDAIIARHHQLEMR